MRQLFCLVMLAGACSTAFAQEKVIVSGSISDLKAGTWVYCNPASSEKITDSALSTAGAFTIPMSIRDGGDLYVVHVGRAYEPGSYSLVYLDKGDVAIKGDGPLFKNATKSGGAGNTDLQQYNTFIKERPELAGMDDLQRKMQELYKKHDSLGLQAAQAEYMKLDSLKGLATESWIRDHMASPISAYLIGSQLAEVEPDKRAELFNSLSPEAKINAPAKRLANTIRIEALTAVGKPALDFTQADTAGRPVSLKSFRGKYVLVDFWASWCGPCRAENPNVVAAYKKYKDKGFTVLSVSLDQPGKKKAWLDAIHKDHLTWTHVSDLKFWNNAIAELYDIKGIPANLLVDRHGMIVGKNLRGEELEKKLKEVLE